MDDGARARGRRIAVTANCQAAGIISALRFLLPDDEVVAAGTHRIRRPGGLASTAALIRGADAWVVMPALPEYGALVAAVGREGPPQTRCPSLHFGGFHPDVVIARTPDGLVRTPDDYQSGIGLWAWRNGLSPAEAAGLFTEDTFEALGYFDRYDLELAGMADAFAACELDFGPVWRRIKRVGVFMHTNNHASGPFINAVSRQLGARLGARQRLLAEPIDRYLRDQQAAGPIWPVYPAIGERLGFAGSYRFRLGGVLRPDLAAYLQAVWTEYAAFDPEALTLVARDQGTFDTVLGDATGARCRVPGLGLRDDTFETVLGDANGALAARP